MLNRLVRHMLYIWTFVRSTVMWKNVFRNTNVDTFQLFNMYLHCSL